MTFWRGASTSICMCSRTGAACTLLPRRTARSSRVSALFWQLEPGPKLDLPFPEMVAKSPLSVVGAFLAGLVDSDGYVESARDRVTYTTQARQLAEKVQTLCSLLGLAPSIRTRQPHGKGRSVVYEVKLASEPLVSDLRTLIGPYLIDSLQGERLAATRGSHEHSTATRLPIPFSAIEDILQSIGITTDTTPIHRQPVLVGETEIWLHRWKEGQGVNSEKLAQLVAALRPQVDARYQARLDVLEHLARAQPPSPRSRLRSERALL